MEEIVQENKRLKSLLIAVLVALVLILLFLLLLVIRDYHRAKSIEAGETSQTSLSTERKTGPLSKVEVGDIASWMTFDYVNYLFALSPGYLKAVVPITDPAYPHLSINSYAHYVGQSRATVVSAIQNAVAAYFNTASSTTQ